ncbi:hypothetical protein B4N89_04050 [Embleya scabrispora]|uniref:Uncharacterized protein n=1 Tax=Embleya scabrispora TaxID=159449 RepID=A0A1T3NTW7_9ACTN|nr:hypothetical protein B4N89_04050 [Embleya scabrispora]
MDGRGGRSGCARAARGRAAADRGRVDRGRCGPAGCGGGGAGAHRDRGPCGHGPGPCVDRAVGPAVAGGCGGHRARCASEVPRAVAGGTGRRSGGTRPGVRRARSGCGR